MADAAISVAVPDKFAQRRRWRAFRDPSVEATFREWHRERLLPIMRSVAFGSGVICALLPISYMWLVGPPPRIVVLTTLAINCPASFGMVLATFTKLRRWAPELFTVLNVAIGLSFTSVTSTVFSPTSGAVTCGILVTVFFPLILRVRTNTATIGAVTLTAVGVGLVIDGWRRNDLDPQNGWIYLTSLIAAMAFVLVAAAVAEAGMRSQFVAERTVADQQRRLRLSQRLLRRYAPAAVAARIESGEAETVGQPQRLRVTALSSDVAGFTALADQIDPESLSQIINEYMGTMSDAVESQGGVVTEFAGDGLTAIFGAPEPLEPEEQVQRALAAANAMHARLADLNKSWFRLGIEQPLRVRIGINTGMLSVGTFGSDGRATYTAIGLQMNVAARIQAQCEPGGILLSSASWHLVNDTIECDPLGEVTVKGVHFPISLYAPRTQADRGSA